MHGTRYEPGRIARRADEMIHPSNAPLRDNVEPHGLDGECDISHTT